MHRSRIGVVLIDHPADVHDRALAFWSAAVGAEPQRVGPDREDESEYTWLGQLGGAVNLESQRTGTGTPPRVHLDLETDDVAAEVLRVVALGATIVEERDDYTVLRDPAGMLFCVVPVQTGEDFAANAVVWP